MPEHTAAGWKTPIWDEYKNILAQAEGRNIALEGVERFAFYARSKQAFAVVATG
jgi:L-fucose mutarotase